VGSNPILFLNFHLSFREVIYHSSNIGIKKNVIIFINSSLLGVSLFSQQRSFFKHQYFLIALFPEFFDKKFVLTLKEGLKLVLRFLIFTNLFLPSKILLHNGIRELSEYFFCLYTLFCGGFYTLFGLSYIFLLTETFLIGLLWEYSVLFRLYFSSLFPLNLDLNVVVRFYLGNPSSSAVRGGISLGTFALVGGGLCFQWARECTNCIVAGDLFMENSLVEVKAKIEAYNVKLEQIEVKRIKNFDHFLNKGFSLDEAYSKAATITHEEYGCYS